jgi:hypothetical protein
LNERELESELEVDSKPSAAALGLILQGVGFDEVGLV